MRSAVSLFKFFASLKLAIALLLALAALFAVGTFIESAHGTEAAKLVVYQSPWMALLLILLVLNVAAAALDRLPWKRKHVGFVITHAGIILMLAGSLVTRSYGLEGQMAIAEGETQGRIILGEGVLQFFSHDQGFLGSFRIPPRAFPWTGREALAPNLSLLHYYPKSSRQEKVEGSSNGPAALHAVLESSWMKVDHWLVLDDPARSRILLGPAELRFSKEPFTEEKKAGGPTNGFLEFRFENSTVQIPLPRKAPQKIPLEGTPYQITILRILRDAVVDQGRLLDRSEEWNNPACELLLEGKGLKEKHTVFSKFPEFPTLHGLKPSEAKVEIQYHEPQAEPSTAKNELRFVWQEEGAPLYQIRKGGEISQGRVELGREFETGWMDFKFRVGNYLPHAQVNPYFKEEPLASQAENHVSAVEVELEWGGQRKSFWLGPGDQKETTLAGRTFQILYGFRTLPVGFRIELRDFRMEKYPGTSQPASFESDVILKDDSMGTVRDLTIRMNQPLKHRGFKVFQSGYQQIEGEPEISIFTVARDPGIPIKYAGAALLIGGILTMFYTRRFSGRPQEGLGESYSREEEAVLAR